jgi:hypothetical protein
MKIHLPGQSLSATGRLVAALLALALFLSASVHALAQERFLFIFDTSSAMKKRLPAVETELTGLFASNLSGSMHSGDSVAVWTFGTKLNAGTYPQFTWQPANGMAAVTNIMTFLGQQDYWGETHFDALQPLLDRVISHSERLTIVIFCDGEGEVHWTPYDDGINDSMKHAVAERKKHRQPELMVLRTQHGRYAGGTVTFPPSLPIIPPFPAAPVAPPSVPVPVLAAPAAVPPPAPSLPPMIIVGTSAGTDITAVARFAATNVPVRLKVPKPSLMATPPEPLPPAASVATNEPSKTNPPTAAINPAPVAPTAPVITPIANPITLPATNAMAVSSINAVPTNAVAATTTGGLDAGTKLLLTVGATLFGMAAALVIFLVIRKRRPQTTLITSLMSEDPRLRK